jgi:cellulose synthase/poly-beta-1,6-N-acetylglucosamine synthase-like glycosyltransferase
LPRLLKAMDGQLTEVELDVVAVDSGSTDGTLDILRDHEVHVIEIPPEQFDFGRTRDLAYQNTTGEIVVNLSQDAIPTHTKWLDNLLRPFEDDAVAVSCGTSIPDPERGFPQFAWERNGYMYFTREIKRFVRRYGKGLSFSNSAVRRDVWEALRFSPQATGEDFQFQMKLAATSWKVAFVANAACLHHHNFTTRTLWRRCRNEGMVLRQLGCPYTLFDLAADLGSPRKYVQWLREWRRGSLERPAEQWFPVLRPLAVYTGSRFGRKALW